MNSHLGTAVLPLTGILSTAGAWRLYRYDGIRTFTVSKSVINVLPQRNELNQSIFVDDQVTELSQVLYWALLECVQNAATIYLAKQEKGKSLFLDLLPLDSPLRCLMLSSLFLLDVEAELLLLGQNPPVSPRGVQRHADLLTVQKAILAGILN